MKNKINSVNYYYETQYSSHTCNGIMNIYKEVKNIFRCNNCLENQVDDKIKVTDTYYPTFTIIRENVCLSCWLKTLKS